jgi:diacyltrehalose acyltransferase
MFQHDARGAQMNGVSMAPNKIRGLSVGLLAGACAGLLDLASVLTATPALADNDGSDYTAMVLGHAFLARPGAGYMQQVVDTYVDNPVDFGQPQYTITGSPVSVYTPESNYTTGLTEGVKDLNAAIMQQLSTNPDANVVVAGYSMSNSVITQEMINLQAEGVTDPNLKFVLAENLNNPDGGFFTRQPGYGGTTLPATPGNTPYDTTIYSIEYSGASDHPEYSGDHWAVMNAQDGYINLHPYLLPGWHPYFDPSTVPQAVSLNSLVTNPDYSGTTDYYLIPTQTLPMYDGLFGPSAHDILVQPDMRVLVDLGYDWQSDPSVDTPAVTDNPNIDFTAVDSLMHAGADQGTIAYLVDLHVLPQADLAGIADLYPYAPDIQDLINGGLTNETAAALDASMSQDLLTADLAGATGLFAQHFATSAPQLADHIADMFIHMASTLAS